MAALGRPRGFNRSETLEQVLIAFWVRGYNGTSFADLTAQLGIGAPSLYSAFGDKRTLFKEAVDLYYQRFTQFIDTLLDEGSTAQDAIGSVMHSVAGFYSAPGQPHGCLVNTAAPPSGDHEIEAYLLSLRAAVRQRLEDRIHRGISARELPPKTDAAALADFYWTTILGMSMRSRDGATQTELEETARQIMTAWPNGRTSEAGSLHS